MSGKKSNHEAAIEEKTRQQIARFLPDALAKALSSYHSFMDKNQPSENDAKEFSQHHTACKAAIAHIELLIKLAQWAHLPDARAEDHNHQIVLAAMLQEAQTELSEARLDEGGDSDDSDDSDEGGDSDDDTDQSDPQGRP